ncbi:PH-interacting protein [Tanacetum coccineum]|uniref:PH-interacting protein n=1 Tax=Tanacetum coccineum TaxID=301880 RepID=A0ABQ5J628_9ASTR
MSAMMPSQPLVPEMQIRKRCGGCAKAGQRRPNVEYDGGQISNLPFLTDLRFLIWCIYYLSHRVFQYGDITDLAVSFIDALIAYASNDCIWRIADGLPISILRGHTGAVTTIAFGPRLGYVEVSSIF